MRKKIIITLFLIITLLQIIVPIKTNAYIQTYEIISVPAQLNMHMSENIESAESVENEMTGLDLVAGVLIEPTVEFFTFILDGIMSVLTGVMRQEEIQFIMVEKDKLPELGEGVPFTIDNIDAYRTATKRLDHLKYPRFIFSPEDIFSGEIELLDINFISNSNSDTNWQKIRFVVSEWYGILRMVAIIGLLSVLIYTGIKIILSSNTKDKAKYKQMIVNWFVGVILAFSMHYIMVFILAIMEEILGLLNGLTGVIEVTGGEGINFKTNLIGLARFQMQQQHFSAKIGHLVIYTALVVYTFKFTFVYLKRVLKVAFLTIIAPIVALTYPIDKMEGEAKGFQMWLKEFIYNALLQPMHYILYYILVTTSLSLTATNPIYGIAALAFMSHAEKLLKKIFGFDKARAGTVGGISRAFATGAIVSTFTNYVKDPTHPLGIGKGNGKSGGKGSGGKTSNSGNFSDDRGVSFWDDLDSEENLVDMPLREQEEQSRPNQEDNNEIPSSNQENTDETPMISNLGRFFEIYRRGMPKSIKELGGLSYDNDEIGSFEDILKFMEEYKRTGVNPGTIPALAGLTFEEVQNVLRNRVDSNEIDFLDNNMQLQYIDGEPMSSSDLLEEIMRLNSLAAEAKTPEERQKYISQSQKLLKKLKQRMAQNEYIQRNGGVSSLYQQEEERINRLMNTDSLPKNNENTIDSQPQLVQQGVGERTQEQQKSDEPIQEKVQEQLRERAEEKPQERPQTIAQRYERRGRPARTPSQREIERDERKLRREQSWEKFKVERVAKGIKNVGIQTGKTIIKPVWDTERGLDWRYNGKRLAKNVLKGAAGVTVGVAAAAVQAGISITDGKYKALEGVATVGAGMAGTSALINRTDNKIAENIRDEKSLERYREQWFNRDDVISNFNIEYPGEGKVMRRRAVDNYVSRGITDFKDQKQAMKYANTLKKERGLNEEEADKIAIATLQYKRSLTRTSSYMILFDEKKREQYLKTKVDAYTGASSKDSIRRLHTDLIENVRDFDRVNS